MTDFAEKSENYLM